MAIDPQRISDSQFAIRLVSALGRGLPRRLGYTLADFIAEQIANQQDSKIVRAVRANQWVVRGEALEKEALDRAVRETLRHTARAIFDLYHYIRNPEATRRLVVLDATTQQLLQRPEFGSRGLVVAGLHLSNFDLVLQWICKQGLRALVLTIPNPQGAQRVEYEMRKKTGMNLLLFSVGTMKQAIQYLQQGGGVMTGIDRPISETGARPRFFNRLAALPMHHVFLAVKAHVPVMVMVTKLQPDGKCHVLGSDLIEMDSYPDRDEETLRNAEKVLSIAEGYIRQAPQQWSVSLPVWPEVLDLVPH